MKDGMVVLDDGSLMCMYCHTQAAEQRELVHTIWCDALSLGLQGAVRTAQRAAAIAIVCTVATTVIFVWNHLIIPGPYETGLPASIPITDEALSLQIGTEPVEELIATPVDEPWPLPGTPVIVPRLSDKGGNYDAKSRTKSED